MTDPMLGRRGLIAAAGLAAVPFTAWAQPAGRSAVIDVDRARSAPIPVAVPPFAGGPLGAQIAEVVTADLQNSGLFRPVAGEGVAAGGAIPDLQNWRALGAQALVAGAVSDAGGSVRVEFRLWDVLPGTQLQGTSFTTSTAGWRRIAHKIADVVYQRLVGERGYFDTRIVYVAQTGPKDRRVKRLAIMDQDSAANHFLTDGSVLVLTPRFHPTRDEIAFMSYANNRPRVTLFDLTSGRQQSLGEFSGITLSPRFSPDGGSLALAQTHGGGSNIHVVDLASRASRQLTSGGAIDVSPCYSPDGSQIVFNSDRGGDLQLYVLGSGGDGVRRSSYGSGRYATPVWSPRGDLIAFTRLAGGSFAIGVMHPDGTGERILSESYDVEGPTFCPNGRVVMFWRGSAGANASARLVSIDIAGFNERQVATPTDASDPAWSPLSA